MWQAGFCYWNKSPLAVQSSLQGPYLCIERILSIKCSPGILLFSQALLLPFESISKACWPALLAASGVYQLRLVRRDNLVESNVLLQAKLLQIKKKWKRVICALAGTSSAQICWLGSLFLSFVCCHNHSRQECEGQRTLWPDRGCRQHHGRRPPTTRTSMSDNYGTYMKSMELDLEIIEILFCFL